MDKVKLTLDKVLRTICCTAFVVMILMASWQVITRFILGQPSSFTEEFLRYALIWVSMLGSAYAVGTNGHIAIKFLEEKMEGNDKQKLEIVVQVFFMLFFVLVMIIGGSRAVGTAMPQRSPSLHLPMGYVYLSLPVSGVISVFYGVYNIRACLNAIKGGK